MNTIQQTVTIPANRRLHLDLTLPDSVPEGSADVLVVISSRPREKGRPSILHLAGSLAQSRTFAGDPVAMQRGLRDEW